MMGIQLPVIGNAIGATALWIYGLAFFVNGIFTLGKCEQKGHGIVNVVAGVFNMTFAFILVLASLIAFWQGKIPETTASFNVLVGLLIWHFGVPTQTIGWGQLFRFDHKASAWALIYIAAFLLVYCPLFISLNAYWFAANVVLWAWIVISFVLVVYGKLNPKISGWCWIIESVITCFVPAAIMMLGYPLP